MHTWAQDHHQQGTAHTALQCVAVRCSMLLCVWVCCSVSQCVAVCCSVSQCVAVRCIPEHKIIVNRGLINIDSFEHIRHVFRGFDLLEILKSQLATQLLYKMTMELTFENIYEIQFWAHSTDFPRICAFSNSNSQKSALRWFHIINWVTRWFIFEQIHLFKKPICKCVDGQQNVEQPENCPKNHLTSHVACIEVSRVTYMNESRLASELQKGRWTAECRHSVYLWLVGSLTA